MVNKQYNIQNLKKPKNRSPPLRRNVSVISNVPNPQNCAIGNNLDPISEELNNGSSMYSVYEQNLAAHINGNDYSSGEDIYEKLNRDLTINDIGRFQYILQMDKEMDAQTNQMYKVSSTSTSSSPPPPLSHQMSFNPYSTTNSINSNNQINFWKAGSQTPITLPPYRSRRQRYRQYFSICWKYLKWPLVLLTLCAIIAMLIYFLFIEIKLADNLSKNQLILNSIDDDDQTDNIQYRIVTTSIYPTVTVTQSEEPTTITRSSSIPSILSNLQQNPRLNDRPSSQTVITSTQSTTHHQPSRNTKILEISTPKLTTSMHDWSLIDEEEETKILLPTKETLEYFGFTSGHQNNFGIPIEEDERILRMLNEQIIKNEKKKKNTTEYLPTTTDSNVYRTRVSPTLPLLHSLDVTTEDLRHFNTSLDDEICQSTSLPLCRSVLHYDLTVAKRQKDFTSLELQHFEYLTSSKCSLRSHEFICSVLEPECRPKRMGALHPCKRVCKSILEPCGHIIAASEILTLLFDCDSYPDSNDPAICRDITRNKKCFPNEFQCQDLTCIPLQWKCDNIKDCAAAEDENNCKFCEQDEFRCIGTDKCIPEKWRCDDYEDCPDATDEIDCFDVDSKTSIPAFDNIYFQLPNDDNEQLSTSNRPYLTISGDDQLNIADTKERKRPLYVTTENGKDKIYSTTNSDFELIDTTTKSNDNNGKDDAEEFQGAASGIIVPISKSIANFQDSKEIMMTSDSESDYKYSSSNIVTTKTSHSSPCPEGELRCISGRCITISQLCDKVTDCPDGADEAMCVFKNPN